MLFVPLTASYVMKRVKQNRLNCQEHIQGKGWEEKTDTQVSKLFHV